MLKQKRYLLFSPEGEILIFLYKNLGFHNIDEISEITRIPRSTISQKIPQLQIYQLIEVEQREEKRGKLTKTITYVKLSEKGKEFIENKIKELVTA